MQMKYFPLTTQVKQIRQSGEKSSIAWVNMTVLNVSPGYYGILLLAAVASEEDKSPVEWIHGDNSFSVIGLL